MFILAVWWVDSSLNNVTLEAGFEFWPGPSPWLFDPRAVASPQWASVSFSQKIGRITVPTLVGCNERGQFLAHGRYSNNVICG